MMKLFLWALLRGVCCLNIKKESFVSYGSHYLLFIHDKISNHLSISNDNSYLTSWIHYIWKLGLSYI